MPGTPPVEISEAVATVKRYFEGEAVDFSGFSSISATRTTFFRQVYDAARQVGWGHTTSDLARWRSNPGAGPEAARDVGQASATNPVALIIPCHRVLAAGGKVGGLRRRAVRRRRFACSSCCCGNLRLAAGAAIVRFRPSAPAWR